MQRLVCSRRIRDWTEPSTPLTHAHFLLRLRPGASLEALAVDDGGAGLVVLLLADPHLLEGGEGGEDGAADPDGVLPLWGSDDLQETQRASCEAQQD